MNKRVLVKRYAKGFLHTIADEAAFRSHYDELLGFEKILSREKKLREVLYSPFLPLGKKRDLLQEIVDCLSFQPKNKRFVLLLVENERFELFSDILVSLPDLWNELNNIATFEVSSVIPLTNGQKTKLEEKLSQIEKKPVFLKFKEDPTLLGGISVRRGNVIYDASIRGNLERLKEIIIEG